MKTIIFLLIFILLSSQKVIAQVSLQISKVVITHITSVEKNDSSIRAEDEGYGPFASFYCIIYNNTDSSLALYPSKAILNALYDYKGISESKGVLLFNNPFYLDDKYDTLLLNKNESIDFSFGVSIFWQTNVWKEDLRWDYKSDINEILSTLKVSYKDSLLKIVSSKPEIIILERCNH